MQDIIIQFLLVELATYIMLFVAVLTEISMEQGNTESLYANVDKAQEEGKTEMSVLKKPFRIELRKTAVVASYRAYLLGVSLH